MIRKECYIGRMILMKEEERLVSSIVKILAYTIDELFKHDTCNTYYYKDGGVPVNHAYRLR